MEWTKAGERLFKALFGGGDVLAKEKAVIAKLKTRPDGNELVMMCAGLQLIGSLYSIPTLMALLRDNRSSEPLRALQNAFDHIAYQYLTARNLPERYFSPAFWEPVWTGSNAEFLSLMQVLENGNVDLGEAELERLGDAFIRELKLNIAPYSSYRELKLCAPEWDIENDLAALLESAQTDILLQPVLDNNKIELHSEMAEFIANQKNDYLLTRVKLSANFELNHYVLGRMACLNRPEPII
jgi:hypothetical protein